MSKSYKFDPDNYDSAYAVRQLRREDRKIEAQLRRSLQQEERANG